eukprot:5144993-Prymnesium_polylepis.1
MAAGSAAPFSAAALPPAAFASFASEEGGAFSAGALPFIGFPCFAAAGSAPLPSDTSSALLTVSIERAKLVAVPRISSQKP